MRRLAVVALACVALAGCANLSGPMAHEQADTVALDVYSAVAEAVVTYEAAGGDHAKGESVRSKAWVDLATVRASLTAGEALVVALAPLLGDQTAASALGH